MQGRVSGWCSCFASPISARKLHVVHINPKEHSRNNWLPLLCSSRGSLHQRRYQPSCGASWASIERLLIQSLITFYPTWKEIMPTCKPGTGCFSLSTGQADWVTIPQVKANGCTRASPLPLPQVLFLLLIFMHMKEKEMLEHMIASTIRRSLPQGLNSL